MNIFGTDGVRGRANEEPMTATTLTKFGIVVGSLFLPETSRGKVIVGKDTRLSGYLIESAITAGLASAGMDSILVGPMPTPAISMLTKDTNADLGIMISASHNPFEDNGIKLFGPDGYKLTDEMESKIENMMNQNCSTLLASPKDLGRAFRLEEADRKYIEYLKKTMPKGKNLKGLKVVLDCANGSAYRIAPLVLLELGAEVTCLADNPDGLNINSKCGALDTKLMQETVCNEGAHIGIALDGDADRLIMADEKGEIIDGDQILATIAQAWKTNGKLLENKVIGTVMSNFGLEQFLNSIGVDLVRVQVGDRFVGETMRSAGCNLGGEQSGHTIISDYSVTGDGILVALQVLSIITESDNPTSKSCRLFRSRPQIQKNVSYSSKRTIMDNKISEIVEEFEKMIGDKGRLLVRKSGTEPVIRVMAEGEDREIVSKVVDNVAEALENII